MAEPETKIKIKIGDVEIDYEGPAEFFRKELHDFIVSISKANSELGIGTFDPKAKATRNKNADTNLASLGTVRTIAAKLVVQSGTDLILATAAFMTFAHLNEQS